MKTPRRSGEGLHILLVGDDAEYRARLHRDLGRYHAHLSILHVQAPEDFERALAARTPDIIILEDPWCGEQGLELLREIKEGERGIRTLLIVPPGREASVARAVRWGLDGHLLATARHLELLADAVEAILALPPAHVRPGDDGTRVLMNRLNFGSFRATLRGQILEGSATFLRLLGLDRWEALSDLRLQEILPDDEQRERLLLEVPAEGSFRAGRLRLRRPDGVGLPVSLTAVASKDVDGETVILGTVEELIAPEAPGRGAGARDAAWPLVEAELPLFTWTTDANLLLRTLEGPGLAALGLVATDLLGLTVGVLFGTEEGGSAPLAAHLRALAGEVADLDLVIRGIPHRLRVQPLASGGRVIGCAGAAVDVSRAALAEGRLQESEEVCRRFMEDDISADFLADGEGRLSAVNPAFARLLGFIDEEDARGLTIAKVFRMPGEASRLIDELQEEHRIEGREFTLVHRDGSNVEVVANLVATLDEHADVVEVRGYLQDETARKALEKRLEQAQRLEAVGRLAGGVAHDFNNILTAINGYAALLLKQAESESATWRSAQAIQKAGEQASSLTKQLMAFSRRQILQPKAFGLDRVIADMKEMLQHLLGRGIEFHIRPAGEECRVQADRNQVEQVIMNLVLNARDAMPEGGSLEVSTSRVELGEEECRAIGDLRPGPYALLQVSDTGVGMDEKTLERVFEPFFTTKSEGEGTGLGLATAHGIITESGGGIRAESRPEQGTTFSVYLPLSSPRPARRPAPPAPTAPAAATILVCEDDENVRSLASQVLSMEGYAVILASSGREAVQKAREDAGGIDLLLTDVVLPDFSGRELAEILRASRPALRVLYMSAHAESAVSHRGVRTQGRGYLQKPFTPDQLAARIRALLSEGGRAADTAQG